MIDRKIFAVLTGDLVGSSKLDVQSGRNLIESLYGIFSHLKPEGTPKHEFTFQFFRGDSFQCVLSEAKDALKVCIVIRASISSLLEDISVNEDQRNAWYKIRKKSFDARIGIGIGTVDYLPDQEGVSGSGQAFLNSGKTLDTMKKEQRLRIKTEYEFIDKELNTSFGLLDVLIKKWLPTQSIAIKEELNGLTQEQIAVKLGVTQAAVQQRLSGAGNWAITRLCARYEELIDNISGN